MKDAISFVRRGPFGGTGKGAQGRRAVHRSQSRLRRPDHLFLKDPFWTSKKDKVTRRSGRRSARESPSATRRRADFIAEAEEEPVVSRRFHCRCAGARAC